MRTIPRAEDIQIVRAEDPDPPPAPAAPLPDTTPVSELSLTARPRGVLRSYRRYDLRTSGGTPDDWGMPVELATVGDIRRESDASFLRQDNFGRKSLKELREACGDLFPHYLNPPRPTMVEALGADKAAIVTAIRSIAGNLYRLADLVEAAIRKGSL
jgi:hypothetical protein